MKFYKKLIFSIALISFFESKAQLFSVIPKNIFQPYLVFAGASKNDSYINDKASYKMELDSFEITNQITYGEYKTYLADVKKGDSSYMFYLKQLPDSTITSIQNYYEYTTDKKYDSFAVIGISWEAAMNFCKWKTVKQNKIDIEFIYRLPKLSEWLNALNYLENKKIENDFNIDFSDWTLSTYYEGNFSNGNSFNFDHTYLAKENEPPRLKRKVAMGDSYLFQKENLRNHWMGYHSFIGYRQIAFRIVKQRLNSKNNKMLNENILKWWNLKIGDENL